MMAYYDRIEAERKEKAKEKFEELKKHISSLDENNRINEFFPALEHMMEMEIRLEEQDKALKRYRAFFVMLRDLTPETFNVNTPIG